MNMKLMNSILLAGLATMLVGCADKPGSSQSDKDAKIAAQDAIEANMLNGAVKITNIQRENGWKQGDTYKISSTYDVQTTVDYPQVLWTVIKSAKQQIVDAQTKWALMNVDATEDGWRSAISDFDETYKRAKVDLNLPAFKKYIASDSELASNHTYAFNLLMLAENTLVGFHIADNAPVGTLANQKLTLNYHKTENGWEKVGN